MINEHETQFYGLPVVNFNPELGIENPTIQVYRINYHFIEYNSVQDLEVILDNVILEDFLNDPHVNEVPALIIGYWNKAYEIGGPEDLLQQLIEQRDKLPNLKALFVGDMTSEEREISWIIQTDYAPLLNAFPQLEELRVRGSSYLQFSQLRHNRLKRLIIESGGLGSSVIESVINAKLPALEHLELWLGDEMYGFNEDLNTIKALLDIGKYPKLRYLGLRDSQIADEIAIEIANAPHLKQLEVIDLSMGTLSDKGAQALLNCDNIKALKKLDLHFHYLSTEMMEKLEGLGIEVDISDQQQEDENGDRYVAVSE
jgi:hypothetical protein